MMIGGRYRLDERIGIGAMGAVWRGTDELLSRTVAIKELLVAPASSGANGQDSMEEARQRLLREGRIGARLQHPHVISMFDVVLHDDRPWLIMEYLPSKSLAALIKEKGSLEPREVAEIGRQVADGLAAAHQAGVVHRDVKPGNVLIGEDGRVKLTDFGVSRAVDDVQLTRTGLIAGTPAFLAPEVARGEAPTAASDVFALGATLYAAVEGTPPFGLDDNAYALLHKVATGRVTPPVQAGPLTATLMRLLAMDPAERPTAAQARDALAAVAAGRPAPIIGGGSADGAVAVQTRPLLEPTGAVVQTNRLNPDTKEVELPLPPPRRPGTPVVLGVLGVLLVLVGVLVGFLVFPGRNAGSSALGNAQPGATPPVVTEQPSASPASTTAPATTTTTAPPTTTAAPTTTPAPSGSGDIVSFVESYYALLPENIDAAWTRLSAQAQAQSGNRSGYERFWSGIRDVRFENGRDLGGGVVQGTVVFVRNDGTQTREPYRFVITGEGDNRVIQTFTRL